MLSSQGEDTENSFFNLPACARIIADQVERESKSNSNIATSLTDIKSDQQEAAKRLFMQILNRENIRQSLQVKNMENLYQAFEALAAESPEEFDLEDICILTDEIPDKNIHNIKDHAFIKEKSNSEKYTFKYEFLKSYLQAIYMNRLMVDEESILNHYEHHKDFKHIIKNQADGSGHLCEQITRILTDTEIAINLHNQCNSNRYKHLKSFLFHVISKRILSIANKNRKERGDILLNLFGYSKLRKVKNLYIQGALENEIRIDNWEICDSIFVDFVINKESNLRFSNCTFSGNTLPNEKSQYENCNGADDASRALIAAKAGAEIDHSRNLRLVLKRFWFNGKMRHEVITEAVWLKGNTAAIEKVYNNKLLPMLTDEKILEIKYNRSRRISLCSAARSNVQAFMDNELTVGHIGSIIEKLKQ